MAYFYFDIETCPLDREKYLRADEEGKKKLLNPIDSRIVAIGVKKSGTDTLIIRDGNEKKMLEEFWAELATFRKGDPSNKMVGFNVKDFDLPFLVTRSFINNVQIIPFLLKDVLDLRENLSAFKFGHVRGKLKEFAVLIGIEVIDEIDGEKIAEICWAGEEKKLVEYLKKDIEITEAIHKRMKSLRIDEIQKW